MKRVIRGTKEPETVVHVDKFDEHKIYFSKTSTGLYKLQNIRSYWMFVDLACSFGGSNGSHTGAIEAIKYQLEANEVFEFDTLKEAMEELL